MKNGLMALAAPAAASLLALGISQPASALMIIDDETVNVNAVGDSFTVDYVCLTSDTCGDAGSPPVDLTAASTWTVTTFDTAAGVVVFGIEMTNTTNDPGSTTNRITKFGVKVLEPDPISATADNTGSSSDPDWKAAVDKNFPTFKKVDLLIKEDDKGSAGVLEGQSDDVILTLSGFTPSLSTIAGLTLQIFPIKYQGVGVSDESFQFRGIVVPEPASLLLFGTGLLGLGFLVRRRGLLAA